MTPYLPPSILPSVPILSRSFLQKTQDSSLTKIPRQAVWLVMAGRAKFALRHFFKLQLHRIIYSP